jgi:hypothetical protein
MVETVPIEVVCQFLGLNGRRVQQLTCEGVLPRAERGCYDLEGCVRGYIEFLKRHSAGDERARLLAVRADLAELELAQRRGDVVPLDMLQTALERTFTA